MSTNDFKEEPRQETREHLSEEEIVRTLIDEFNAMFTRESLENNPYLILKMSPGLEIPVTAIYKDKKVSSICTNLAIIREALSKSTSVTYNREKEVLLPNMKAMRNKIVLSRIPDMEKDKLFKTIYQSPEYNKKISDKYIENLKSFTLILRSEHDTDSIIEKIKAAVHKESQLDVHVEYEDLYLDLLQKAQDTVKSHSFNPEEHPNFPYEAFMQNYGYFYGVNPYMNPYMGMMGNNSYGYRGGNYNNQYYNNNYYNQMFIRKAQDEATEATEPQRGEYHGRYGKKKDKFTKKPYFQKQQRSDTKDNKQMSTEEIKRRTRVNSENFPPLLSDEKTAVTAATEENPEEEEAPKVSDFNDSAPKGRIKYSKDDIIRIFKQSEQVKPNEKLRKFNELDVPVLNLSAKPNLEFIEPSARRVTEPITRKFTEDKN